MSIPYFVMGYLEGSPLIDVIVLHQKRKTGFALPFFYSIFRDVVQALHHAHSKSIFHRDLKPENILVSPKRRAFLLDFGLAKLLHDDRIIPKNYILGTPQYMAPEQVRNKEVDHRSDIYSLGMIMYVCLTGRLPFMDKDGMKGAKRRLKEDFPPPSRRNPSVPKEIDEIVMRCLAREMEDRFQLISDVTLAMRRSMDEQSNQYSKKVSRPNFNGDSQSTNEAQQEATSRSLSFVRKPSFANSRLDEIIEIFKRELRHCRELNFPNDCSIEQVGEREAEEYPRAFGSHQRRSEELRFIVLTHKNRYRLFIKFRAIILRGELQVHLAYTKGEDDRPNKSFNLELAGWKDEEAVDWQEVFRGVFARFAQWSKRN